MKAEIKKLTKTAKAYAVAGSAGTDLGLQFAEQLQDFGWDKDEKGKGFA